MGQNYEKNKVHILKWQHNNKAKVNEACRTLHELGHTIDRICYQLSKKSLLISYQ